MGCLLTIILFAVVLALLIVSIILLALAVSIGGVIGLFLFSDVIICAFVIVWLIKRRKKHN